MVQVLRKAPIRHHGFEQHLQIIQGNLGAILVCEVKETVENDRLVLDAALVEEHNHQAE